MRAQHQSASLERIVDAAIRKNNCGLLSFGEISRLVLGYKYSHQYKSLDLQLGHTGIRSILLVSSVRLPTRFGAISLRGPVISQ